VAYADNTNYVISFMPEHVISQNGYIDVEFPPEVTIPDKSYSQSSCVADETSGFPTSQITCEFLESKDASQDLKLRIRYAFRRTQGEGMVEYRLTIPGIRNPIKTIPTGTFKFASFTRSG